MLLLIDGIRRPSGLVVTSHTHYYMNSAKVVSSILGKTIFL